MNERKAGRTALIGGLCLCLIAAFSFGPARAASDDVARGRYIVVIGGCNDCHTPGYLLAEGKVPEERWLTGDKLGWRGPWGTTYASNLRLFLSDMAEDDWVATSRALRTRPPMPWFNLQQMHEEDLRALYKFVKSLGPAGQPAPDYLPPDKTPPPPFTTFP